MCLVCGDFFGLERFE